MARRALTGVADLLPRASSATPCRAVHRRGLDQSVPAIGSGLPECRPPHRGNSAECSVGNGTTMMPHKPAVLLRQRSQPK